MPIFPIRPVAFASAAKNSASDSAPHFFDSAREFVLQFSVPARLVEHPENDFSFCSFRGQLSNLLQLDRFEEDLNIRRVRLEPSLPSINPPDPLPEKERELRRQRCLEQLRQIKDMLR